MTVEDTFFVVREEILIFIEHHDFNFDSNFNLIKVVKCKP